MTMMRTLAQLALAVTCLLADSLRGVDAAEATRLQNPRIRAVADRHDRGGHRGLQRNCGDAAGADGLAGTAGPGRRPGTVPPRAVRQLPDAVPGRRQADGDRDPAAGRRRNRHRAGHVRGHQEAMSPDRTIRPAGRCPAVLPPDLRPYLGVSPSIETTHVEIKRLAGEIAQEATTDWDKVKAIYDWVRANVRYEFDAELKGALTALRAGHGDCEELTSLFIALCRANGIPARSVWIPGHCYPEFYLQTPDGRGRWFPCQAAGAEEFGSMHEARPILQKGDNFRVPGEAAAKRYVAETFRAQNAVANPRVEWVRKPLGD